MRTKRTRRQAGITLIEMLVVVTIIMLFVGVVGVNMLKKADPARHTAARAQIRNFMNALNLYKLETGTLPTTEQGLQALRTKPQGVNNWGGPYLEQDLPVDPWGRAYIYRIPGEHGDFDILSYGADGQPGGTEVNADIVSWKSQ